MITMSTKEQDLYVDDFLNEDRLLVMSPDQYSASLLAVRLAKALIKKGLIVGVVGQISADLDDINFCQVTSEKGADIYIHYYPDTSLMHGVTVNDFKYALTVGAFVEDFKGIQFDYTLEMCEGFSRAQRLLQATDWLVLRELERKFLAGSDLLKYREALRTQAGLIHENNVCL
ncbi:MULTISPECIES: hypothetical protein [Gammaproteobacteria]|uniref:hypothetical protein n=1 Tax=Gammaproteobacteria TaxID=1236 RepID=UPI00224F28EB|nr:hypothetical protein [Aeromonas caviae]MCX4071911.1 hypothetical protein [Aeromonas caviae]HDT5861820.1 hypothetical protein [Aeromonas hydrophila subsp. hydrophila]